MDTLGGRIRSARKEAGLSQVALAQEIGTTHRTIVRWEKGHTLPNAHFRRRIVEVTGRDVFNGEEGDGEEGE